jgi:hypothetical protein
MADQATEPTAISLLSTQLQGAQRQIDTLSSERAALEEALAHTGRERDEMGRHLANPDAQSARIAELQAELRDRDNYEAFAKLARAAGAKENAIPHLWSVTDYEPDSDEVDEEVLGELVTHLKTAADYAFESPAGRPRDERGRYITPPPPPPGGRGGRNQGGDGTIITAEMRADPRFMLDPRNKEIIAQAAREGRFR